MKISVTIDKRLAESTIEIRTPCVDDTLQALIDQLNEADGHRIPFIEAKQGNHRILLKAKQIMRIYSSMKKVFVQTKTSTYELSYRLYQIETLMTHSVFRNFARVSNTDIVNFDYVKYLDMSLAGTICIHFTHGTEQAFVSRRYIPKIKAWLGIQ